MKLGIDVDGVLADFNTRYIERCVAETGRDLFPPRPFDIQTWNYPESYGYTNEEVAKVWASIKADPFFWQMLDPYPGAVAALDYLKTRIAAGDDVYFVTARPGIAAKSQTEAWLTALWPSRERPMPTVLIASNKGLAARTLELDVYIDDRWENVVDVKVSRYQTAVFLMDRSWNQDQEETFNTGGRTVSRLVTAADYGISRVSSVVGIVEAAVAENVATPILQTSDKA